MAGRPPKPTALKLVTGNPGKRKLNKQEPDPPYLTDLAAPAWLDPLSRQVWDEVAPSLAATKVLTKVDVQALAMGCVSIAQYRLSVARVGDQLVKGKEVLDEEGSVKTVGEHINPWMLVQSMSFKQASQLFQQFGMTPAARTRIAIQPQGDLFAGENGGGLKSFLG